MFVCNAGWNDGDLEAVEKAEAWFKNLKSHD